MKIRSILSRNAEVVPSLSLLTSMGILYRKRDPGRGILKRMTHDKFHEKGICKTVECDTHKKCAYLSTLWYCFFRRRNLARCRQLQTTADASWECKGMSPILVRIHEETTFQIHSVFAEDWIVAKSDTLRTSFRNVCWDSNHSHSQKSVEMQLFWDRINNTSIYWKFVFDLLFY